MSAPENSNSKTPPSLLSDTKPAGEGGPQQSRILANLEGRVTPPAEPPRRSLKAPIAAVVALLVAVGGWGAWRWQQPAEPSAVAAAAAPAAAKAAPASGAAVQVAQNAASAAPAAQPATIVTEDAASGTSASSAPAADDSRLSRALADGASDASGATTAGAAAAATTAAAVATTKAAKADAKNTKLAARSKAETKAESKAEARRHRKEAELAQAKKRRDAPVRTAGAKDDPDADLLAALVARTKPADKKTAAQKAQAVPTKTAASAGGSLAARVKECSQRGFFEDQLCRWRVCEGQWGKDPACPNAAQAETRQ
ncbi:hypothetical protein [Burkholderia pseudomultivorans]|uniref:hypothetical protein n=1 Tax=Burkholderia pseudomultivorans TaxID=1207504 RepID=UPI00075EB797|nr:hypothetical protein [Burkholderia pseudomultivorans]KVG61142.1 phage tail protein [Burkholderia pseudomultivorans]